MALRAPALALLATSALLLAACAGTADESTDTPGEAPGQTPEETTASEPTTGEPITLVQTTPTGPLFTETPLPGLCEDPDHTLAETTFGRHLPAQAMPTSAPQRWFHFTITDEQYNPCLPLSWIILDGSVGDASGPDPGPEAELATIVFFHYTDTITDPPSPAITEVISVERADRDAAEARYRSAIRSPEGGTWADLTVTHTWDGQRLVSGGPDAPAYEAAVQPVITLDPAGAPL